jgi:hypothetical protein
MKSVIVSFLVVLCSGCAVVPESAWSFDPSHPEPKPSIAMADAVALTERVAQLQQQRIAVRDRIAAEPDARKRLGLYEQLHGVGMQLSPLERRLTMVAAAR